MWVANVFFERTRKPTEDVFEKINVRFGSLWSGYDKQFLKLTGFRYGTFAAMPQISDPPAFDGDFVVYGPADEAMNRHEQWCGFIYTEENKDGIIYIGRLEVDPWPLLFPKKLSSSKSNAFGVILNIK